MNKQLAPELQSMVDEKYDPAVGRQRADEFGSKLEEILKEYDFSYELRDETIKLNWNRSPNLPEMHYLDIWLTQQIHAFDMGIEDFAVEYAFGVKRMVKMVEEFENE